MPQDTSTGKTQKELKGRVFNCLQYEINPKTGADLHFNESNILNCIKHKVITRYAYIKHDKDVVTEYDIETGKGAYTDADLGKPKGIHWHVVLETKNNRTSVLTIAKWLGIPKEFVEIPKKKANGEDYDTYEKGKFIDCVEYLRHSDIRQALKGKYEYSADEVKANFDWQSEVEAMVLRKTKYEKPLSERQFVKNQVLYAGMTIGEVIERYPTFYAEEMTIFQKLRTEYINRCAPLPAFRVNYYIYGGTGSGKDTMAHTLAKMLFPGAKYDDDVYFEVGAKKVSFSAYDGQPVIIWSEFRAQTFLDVFGGYEGVLSSLDIIPKNKREHRKFGDIKLINSINIVTSTEEWVDFWNGLIGQDDPDPTQVHRRFPVVIPIHADYFEILLNNGYLGSDTFSEYTAWRAVTGSFGELARRLNARPALFERATGMLAENIVDAHKEITSSIKADPYSDQSDEEVMQMLEAQGYGKCRTAEELKIAAEEEFLQRMAEREERAFDTLVEFGHWFWEESWHYPNAVTRNNKNVTLPSCEDNPVRQYEMMKEMSSETIQHYMDCFIGADADKKDDLSGYSEGLIRDVIERVFMDAL